MSISIGTDGRIVTGRTNVIIPPENAGVGDLVYKLTSLLNDKAANNTPSNFKVVGRGTADAATVTVNDTSYTLYGCIYGFVNGEAMICAPSEDSTNKVWGSYVSGMPYASLSTILLRNGIKASSSIINLQVYINYGTAMGTAGTLVHPTDAYNGGVMTNDTFTSGTDASCVQARAIYGTYNNYLTQLRGVNGAPGSPFGITADGVKVHEFGRWMCQTYFSNTSNFSSSTAGGYCYAYREGNGTWWLPSLFELNKLLSDKTLAFLNVNNGMTGWTAMPSYFYWSCVPITSNSIWCYSISGRLDHRSPAYALAIRPVTLLKLY